MIGWSFQMYIKIFLFPRGWERGGGRFWGVGRLTGSVSLFIVAKKEDKTESFDQNELHGILKYKSRHTAVIHQHSRKKTLSLSFLVFSLFYYVSLSFLKYIFKLVHKSTSSPLALIFHLLTCFPLHLLEFKTSTTKKSLNTVRCSITAKS